MKRSCSITPPLWKSQLQRAMGIKQAGRREGGGGSFVLESIFCDEGFYRSAVFVFQLVSLLAGNGGCWLLILSLLSKDLAMVG